MLFQRRRYHRRPRVSARINKGHPLARGLVGAWLFNEGGGGIIHDLCARNDGAITGGLGSDIVWTDDSGLSGEPSVANGLNFSGDANNNRVDLGSITSSNPLSLAGKTQCAFAFGISLPNDALTTNAFPRIIDKSNAGTGGNGWSLWIANPGTRLAFARAGTSVESAETPDSVLVEGGYADVFVWRDGTTVGFSRDGALTQTATGLGTTAFVTTTTNAAIGNWNHSTDRALYGSLYYLYVWDRLLPQDTATALARDPYQFVTSSTDFALFEAIREIPGMISADSVETAWEANTATVGASTLISAGVAETAWEGAAAGLNKHALIDSGAIETAWTGEHAQLNRPIAADSVDTVWEQHVADLNKHFQPSVGAAETAWEAAGASIAKNMGISANAVSSAWEGRRQGLYQLISAAWETGAATISVATAISAGGVDTAWEIFGVGFATVETAWEALPATFNKHQGIDATVAETALEEPPAGVGYLLHWLISDAALNKHTLVHTGFAELGVEVYAAANLNAHTGIAATAGEFAFEAYQFVRNLHWVIGAGSPTDLAAETYTATIPTNLVTGSAEAAWVAARAAFNKHLQLDAGTAESVLAAHPSAFNRHLLIEAASASDSAFEVAGAFVAPNIAAASSTAAFETLRASLVRDEVNTEWTLPRVI